MGSCAPIVSRSLYLRACRPKGFPISFILKVVRAPLSIVELLLGSSPVTMLGFMLLVAGCNVGLELVNDRLYWHPMLGSRHLFGHHPHHVVRGSNISTHGCGVWCPPTIVRDNIVRETRCCQGCRSPVAHRMGRYSLCRDTD